MATAVVDIASDLVRKKWMREGLIQASHKSFWSSLTGNSAESVVYQANNENAADGHTVVFDFDGNLSGEGFSGKESATGKGEQKRKFSDKLIVQRTRHVVDNGDKFDGVNIGDLSITQHEDSRRKLGDLFMRVKDQTLYDAAQGYLARDVGNNNPTHIIRPNARANIGALTSSDVLGFDFMMELEHVIKTGTGFTSGSRRAPLKPYMTADGRPYWLFVIDSYMSLSLKKETKFQNIMQNADIRGANNRLISGVLGKIGSLVIVEAGTFFGSSSSNKLVKTSVEIPGLRTVDASGTFLGAGTQSGIVASRGVIMGAGALQIGFGKQPDYKFQESTDFAINSESALEAWWNVQKCKLVAENEDYSQAKVAGIDYGMITVETYAATI